MHESFAHLNLHDYCKDALAKDFVEVLDVALWIYDIDEKRVVWANRAALKIWLSPSLEELCSRDLSEDMSPAVEQRLRQYKEDFERENATFSELWTLYPEGKPNTVRVKYRGFRLPNGRMAMLCEAQEEVLSTPEALRSSEALLHTTVMISLLNVDGQVLYCNPAARARYGSSKIDMTDRFVHPDDGEKLFAGIARERRCKMVVEVRTIHGTRWHDVNAYTCYDAATGKRAILLSEVDVTEMQHTKTALEKSRNEALEATRLKSEFLANMSHEIRTPLNGVLGMAQLLQETELTEQQRLYTQTVISSGASLLALIDDVLDISRIEAGLLQIVDAEFDLEQMVKEAIEAVMGVAIQKDLELKAEVQVKRPSTFRGDARRIKQVLINLVGNGVKFTENGRVVVRVRERDETLRFEIIDSGPGIEAGQIEHIFERFRQADGSIARKHGGTGLGLAISKSLVTMMHGEIGVLSTPGKGATFWFELALRRSAPATGTRQSQRHGLRPDGQLSGHPPGLRGSGDKVHDKHVLLVEDNSVNQFLVIEALNPEGYDVTLAENGQEAIDCLQRGQFDLVIMDLQMPVMSGEEAIAAIRSSAETYCDVPILVFTANAMQSVHEQCMKLGANGFLTKPVDIRTLTREVERYLPEKELGA